MMSAGDKTAGARIEPDGERPGRASSVHGDKALEQAAPGNCRSSPSRGPRAPQARSICPRRQGRSQRAIVAVWESDRRSRSSRLFLRGRGGKGRGICTDAMQRQRPSARCAGAMVPGSNRSTGIATPPMARRGSGGSVQAVKHWHIGRSAHFQHQRNRGGPGDRIRTISDAAQVRSVRNMGRGAGDQHVARACERNRGHRRSSLRRDRSAPARGSICRCPGGPSISKARPPIATAPARCTHGGWHVHAAVGGSRSRRTGAVCAIGAAWAVSEPSSASANQTYPPTGPGDGENQGRNDCRNPPSSGRNRMEPLKHFLSRFLRECPARGRRLSA